MEENLIGMDTLVDPFVMKVLICDEFNKENDSNFNYEQIKEYINNAKVTLTRNEIKKFLDNEFDRNCPDLRRRVLENIYSNPVIKFEDRLKAEKYTYSEDTYEYFIRYIDILKNKCLKLLNVIDLLISIKNRDIENKDLSILSDLDINVNNGYILHKDMIRLIKPLMENIFDLKKYVNDGNDVTTYYHTKINKDILYLSGGNFEELFPRTELQINDIECDNSIRGLVPLSDKQKQDLIEKHNKNYSYVLSLLDDLK